MIKTESLRKVYVSVVALNDLSLSIEKGGIFSLFLVARALLPEPKILFLDESAVGLDHQVRRGLWDLIPRLKREGITILLTTSNFFILPMAFFSGTFSPVNEMPCLLKGIIYLLPLTHTNQLMRMATSSTRAFLPLGVLCGIAIVSFVTGSLLIKRYNE